MMSAHPREPLLDLDEVLAILNRISLFGGLDDRQLYEVFRQLQCTQYTKGEFVFREGDAPSDIYIVQSGSVELVLDADGMALAEAEFGVGACFGETAVIGIEPHTASAVVKENAELIILPRTALFDFWDTDKALFGMLVLNIAREACRRLARADEVLLHYVGKGR
jgi:CRP/FNR family cyclic AMP-dependent transcriptional regulator